MKYKSKLYEGYNAEVRTLLVYINQMRHSINWYNDLMKYLPDSKRRTNSICYACFSKIY